MRDRAADRVRNGPRPKTPVPTNTRTPGIRDAALDRAADRIRNGPKPKTPTSGTDGKGSTGTKPDRGPRIRGALRHRAVGRILGGKKSKADPPAPARAKVDLTKKPKPAAGGAGRTVTPRVDLRKKVNLRKKTRRYGRARSGGCFGGTGAQPTGAPGTGPKPTGPQSSGPAPGGARREKWERAGARRSQRASTGPAADTGTKPGAGSGTGPGPDGGGFGPPPGWGHTAGYTVTIERADGGPGSQVRRRPAGALTRGRPGLPAGTSQGGTAVTVPVPAKAPNTQYADSDLTIHDVIDSDTDMAQEIMAGVDEARAAAEGCDLMMTRLEALHQKIVDLKVPGVLEGWVLILAEKAVSVKAKAEALAATLPAASEAIATAGENAERRHKPLADAVRDAGHTAPAERDYHVE
ncbi:hypothetical protein [Streptomyces melanogenes]|uniref:hypothetical protein n=1 Tax=Streptomyces melanogenes TaxID=67326 RepID=UPI00167CDB28|nr:hypothetical protein [Streptomyces melanogenes]